MLHVDVYHLLFSLLSKTNLRIKESKYLLSSIKSTFIINDKVYIDVYKSGLNVSFHILEEKKLYYLDENKKDTLIKKRNQRFSCKSSSVIFICLILLNM